MKKTSTKKKAPAPATNIFADPSAQAAKEQLALVSFDFTPEEAETLSPSTSHLKKLRPY